MRRALAITALAVALLVACDRVIELSRPDSSVGPFPDATTPIVDGPGDTGGLPPDAQLVD